MDLRDLSWHRRHHLNDHRHFHNCPDELRRRDFHIHHHRPNLRDVLDHIGNHLVDVPDLRDFDVLGHLVNWRNPKHVRNSADERHGWDFHRLRHCLKSRDLSLHHHWRDLGKHSHLVDLRDHRHVHNSAGKRHGWDFHRLRHCLDSRDLSLHHQQHVDKRVDVSYLRDLGVLGHLVDRRVYVPRCAPGVCPEQHRPVDNLVDVVSLRLLDVLGHLESRQVVHRLQHSLNLRDLSWHHHSDVDDLVDANLRKCDVLGGHLVDQRSRSAALAHRRSAPRCARPKTAPVRGTRAGAPRILHEGKRNPASNTVRRSDSAEASTTQLLELDEIPSWLKPPWITSQRLVPKWLRTLSLSLSYSLSREWTDLSPGMRSIETLNTDGPDFIYRPGQAVTTLKTECRRGVSV